MGVYRNGRVTVLSPPIVVLVLGWVILALPIVVVAIFYVYR